jgi:NADPH:quinone reductase-like Zn-dependent oxidoreductase
MGLMIAHIDGDDLAELAKLMERGELSVVIDRRYSLSEVPDAIRYSEEGHARGKIIISLE